MSWLNVDLQELEKEQELKPRLEPGVYTVTIENLYVDKTQSGATYFGLNGFDGEIDIKLNGFSVERMVKNKDGNTKSSNGRYFTGLIFLDKIAKCFNKRVTDLIPQKGLIQIFGEQKEVGLFKEFEGKQIVVGLRKVEYEYNGQEKFKFEIVDICCVNDKECIERLRKRIEKNPIKKEKSKEETKQEIKSDDIPF